MIILHVSSISNNQASGMSVVVPLHVKYQSMYADVAFLNCSDHVLNLKNSEYRVFMKEKDFKDGDVSKLPSPYNKPDLVVIHGVYIPFYSKIVKNLIKKEVPYIVVPHGSLSKNAQKIKPIKKVIGNLLVFNHLVNNAISIQYLSVEEKKSTVVKQKHSFIGFNGMNINTKIRKNTPSKTTFDLIYIGRMDPFHKGLDYLLEACNLVKDQMRKDGITLSLYGPDYKNGKEKIENIIKSHAISDIVSLNEGIFGEEKTSRLTNSDVFIQTSRFEGQPLGIMEALSYGVPVIVTPGTNMANEVLENNCGWKAEFTVDDIGKSILKAYKEKEKLKVFSDNGIEFIKNTYKWEKVAFDTVEQYKKLYKY